MLRVEELWLRHKNQGNEVLKNLSFEADKGSITTILGPNGSGKTSILKCIVGLWKNYRGRILLDGRSIDGLSSRGRARLISFVPQEHEPTFPYTLYDFVLLGRVAHVSLFSLPRKRDHEVTEEVLRTLGVWEFRNRPYTRMSGGERQLALIGRALAQETPCILMDEPTSHLDFKNQLMVLKMIRKIADERKKTILITLHDPNLASLFSDKIIVISEGRKIVEGRPKEVISEEVLESVFGVKVKMVYLEGRFLISHSVTS